MASFAKLNDRSYSSDYNFSPVAARVMKKFALVQHFVELSNIESLILFRDPILSKKIVKMPLNAITANNQGHLPGVCIYDTLFKLLLHVCHPKVYSQK